MTPEFFILKKSVKCTPTSEQQLSTTDTSQKTIISATSGGRLVGMFGCFLGVNVLTTALMDSKDLLVILLML